MFWVSQNTFLCLFFDNWNIKFIYKTIMKKTFLTVCAAALLFNLTLSAQQNDVVKHLNISQVNVNASRVNTKLKDLPQKVEIISQRVIQATPAVDLGDLLKKTVGLDIIQYPGVSSSIGMRGFAPSSSSSKYVLILINGKPSGTSNLATIDMSNVEQIEIMKGPFSAQYGSAAMGGIINIVTKESTGDLTGSASLEYGSFDSFKASLNIGGKISSVLDFDASYSYYDRGKDYKIGSKNINGKSKSVDILDAKSYGSDMEHSEFNRQNINARLGFRINQDWKINLNAGVFIGDNIETPGSFWHTYGMNSKELDKYSASLDIVGKVGKHKLTLSPFISNQNSFNNGSYSNSESIFKNKGIQVLDAIELGNHSLAIGLDYTSNVYETTNLSKDGEVKNSYKPNYENASTAMFAQSQLRLLDDKLNISLGARLDLLKLKLEKYDALNSSAKTENYTAVTGNIGAKYNFTDQISIKTSYGTAFLTPDAYQMAGAYDGYGGRTVGNPNLDPEKSNTIDLGLAYYDFDRGVNFEFTYFDTRNTDKIVSGLVDGNKSFVNADKAKMSGIEVTASYDFGSINSYDYSLKAYINYSHLLNAKLTSAGVESNINYVRDNTANFGLEFDNFKSFSTRLNARYLGHRYEQNWYRSWNRKQIKYVVQQDANGVDIRPSLVDANLIKHPVSIVFDWSASYTINGNYIIGASIANILDENYSEKDGYNMPGRSIMLKFTYKL